MKLYLIITLATTSIMMFSPLVASQNFRGRGQDVGRPGGRPGSRPGGRPGGRPDGRPDGRPGEDAFPGMPPMFQNITCLADDEVYEPCELPPKKGRHNAIGQDDDDDDDDDDEIEGIFVCRAKPLRDSPEEAVMRPVCIPSGHGKEGDVCGCCGGTCPTPCGCPCDIERTDRDGNTIVIEGAKILFDDEETWTCVPKFASAKLTFGEDSTASCVEVCEE